MYICINTQRNKTGRFCLFLFKVISVNFFLLNLSIEKIAGVTAFIYDAYNYYPELNLRNVQYSAAIEINNNGQITNLKQHFLLRFKKTRQIYLVFITIDKLVLHFQELPAGVHQK